MPCDAPPLHSTERSRKTSQTGPSWKTLTVCMYSWKLHNVALPFSVDCFKTPISFRWKFLYRVILGSESHFTSFSPIGDTVFELLPRTFSRNSSASFSWFRCCRRHRTFHVAIWCSFLVVEQKAEEGGESIYPLRSTLILHRPFPVFPQQRQNGRKYRLWNNKTFFDVILASLNKLAENLWDGLESYVSVTSFTQFCVQKRQMFRDP